MTRSCERSRTRDSRTWHRSGSSAAGTSSAGADIDDARPCRGATEVEHSHIFTEDGRFGSYDQNGEQVDHGDYTILDDTTLTFPTHAKELGGDITVRYRVQEDPLDLEVVPPDPCTGGCRLSTAWAISAFYPGAFERSG